MLKIPHFLSVVTLLMVIGCSEPTPLAVVSVSETAGLTRNIEYITTIISLEEGLKSSETLLVTDLESKRSIPVQIMDTSIDGHNYSLEVTFPVSVKANQTKNLHFSIKEKMRDTLPVNLMLSEDQLSVENRFYKASFSTENDKRGGQIDGIILKEFNDQILKRGHISMHWAPNFSKSDSEGYFTMESLSPSSKNHIRQGLYQVIKKRSGISDSVPEIRIKGRYEFYVNSPYFLFESTMIVEKDVQLDLLRNDEMTMDSLFTHVMYQQKNGEILHLGLYNNELDVLEEDHIPDNAPWLAFYNIDKGYGFGSIRLAYDNTNLDGNPSPTYTPYTKISRASNSGRYWNRVLIGETDMMVQKGSRYKEKNAYLVFKVDVRKPEKEIMEYYTRLTSPLVVTVLQ
ncbi:MAG: hypothetical protein QM485_07745 [Flavobacteriaceae bacterium]